MTARGLRWSRLALIAVGILVLGYGGFGLLTSEDSRPVGQVLFLAGLLVAHDGVLMPLVLLAGALIGRLVPVTARRAVRLAAVISLAMCVVALPLVLGYGRRPDDPSALPLTYGRGLAVILVLVWTTTLTVDLAVASVKKSANSRHSSQRNCKISEEGRGGGR
jgi:hypothetical protein